MATAATLLAELTRLAKSAGENLFRRIQIAATLSDDVAWIASVGGESPARNYLASFFKDVNDSWSLSVLLALVREFPNIEQWREEKFDLFAMYCLSMRSATQAKIRQREQDRKEHLRMKERERRACGVLAKHHSVSPEPSPDWGERLDSIIASLEKAAFIPTKKLSQKLDRIIALAEALRRKHRAEVA